MIIVIDGPEKAGKTTTIRALKAELESAGKTVVVRRWGPTLVDDREYAPALQEDVVNTEVVTIWDRSWASEHIYASAFNRNKRLKDDAWLGEWLHRRAVDTYGLHYIMLPESATANQNLRDETDLPISAAEETIRFFSYAKTFHWPVLTTIYNLESLRQNVKIILDDMDTCMAIQHHDIFGRIHYAPSVHSIAFVESPTSEISLVGGWLPFTSYSGTVFARQFGNSALSALWATTDADLDAFDDTYHIVTIGQAAEKWSAGLKAYDNKHFHRYHHLSDYSPRDSADLGYIASILKALWSSDATINR